MARCPQVFVSYRRDGLARLWAPFLAKQLEPYLRTILPETRVVWDDKPTDDLAPGGELKDNLGRLLDGSDLMVAVLCNSYWTSGWCMWEWKVFQDASQGIEKPRLYALSLAGSRQQMLNEALDAYIELTPGTPSTLFADWSRHHAATNKADRTEFLEDVQRLATTLADRFRVLGLKPPSATLPTPPAPMTPALSLAHFRKQT